MRYFILSLVFIIGTTELNAQPHVVASIRPLQLIAQAITDGVSDPGVIMDASQDPHHPSLRPSQRLAINEADILIWIGPQFETGFERIFDTKKSSVLTIQTLPELTVHRRDDRVDPHFWLDTGNAAVIAENLANKLVTLDPDNKNSYQANLAAFHEMLTRLDNEVRQLLDAENFPRYAVYHDGYQYFEKQFGLTHLASFTGNEEIQPGIRKVREVNRILAANTVACVIVNPAVNIQNLGNQLSSENLHYAVVDVLGHELHAEQATYENLLKQIAAAFKQCDQNTE